MLVNIIWCKHGRLIDKDASLLMNRSGVSRGYGKHREASGPNIDYDFFLGFFMAEIIYVCIITFVKYATLALYWRIFGRSTVQWPVYILAFCATAWGIAVVRIQVLTPF